MLKLVSMHRLDLGWVTKKDTQMTKSVFFSSFECLLFVS